MSRTALDKMGFKPGMTGWSLARPEALAEAIALPDTHGPVVDLIVAFVTMRAEVARRLDETLAHYRRGGGLWFAYPKRTSTIPTDLSRDHGWEALAAHDMLPVSLVAIDDDWSALRFRYRDEIAKLTRKSA
ncbi:MULTISPECIES: hypothetical protein [unclassified Sphingomonas]|uniref:hypothetical protein n=1 Tax=unclassified Sphingomonas TaxID=196159 RepID=UPI000BD5F02C|nr:MAG: hypothetical protein B7Z43_11980 [Sphingomonas sp. 12-62-6]OYX37882.1 MAG: hypothetical protein B7Y98_10730 [Sphingomonas sp. 32-62-10]